MISEFYTIKIDEKYLTQTMFCGSTVENLEDALRFISLDEAEYYRETYLKNDMSFRIIKVTLIIKEEEQCDDAVNYEFKDWR